jgi:nitrite reductase/ring-hydroxylating ferredoxin subunit/uncharacterized membrane protein
MTTNIDRKPMEKERTMSGILGKLAATSPWLDTAADVIHKAITPILGENAPKSMKDLLYGTWLGHPLHPLLTDVSIGGWTTSMAMDLLGEERAADLALKLGTLSAGATALTGAAQWYDATNDEEPRRLGALHASLNTAALGFYIWSWILRDNDQRTAGITTAWIGHSLSTTSGYIGGHLSFNLGIGVDRTMTIGKLKKWSNTGVSESELAPGELRRIEVKDVPVMLLKQDASLYAASPVCTHLQGPLNEGELNGACVTCPWHGSEFDLTNGNALHGPATASLPIFETRVVEGQIQVRSRPED